MRVGVPREIKLPELRVAIAPAGVRELVARAREVVVQYEGHRASLIPDHAHAAHGATIGLGATEVLANADSCKRSDLVREMDRGSAVGHQAICTSWAAGTAFYAAARNEAAV